LPHLAANRLQLGADRVQVTVAVGADEPGGVLGSSRAQTGNCRVAPPKQRCTLGGVVVGFGNRWRVLEGALDEIQGLSEEGLFTVGIADWNTKFGSLCVERDGTVVGGPGCVISGPGKFGDQPLGAIRGGPKMPFRCCEVNEVSGLCSSVQGEHAEVVLG